MSRLLLEQELAVSHLSKQSVQVAMYEADSLLSHREAVVFCVTLSETVIFSSPYYVFFSFITFNIPRSLMPACLFCVYVCAWYMLFCFSL